MTFTKPYITKLAGAFFARSKVLLAIAGILLLSLLIACASTDDGGGGGGSADTYTVGGTVAGHTGDVSLKLTYGEETETLKIETGTDKFTFAAKLEDKQSFTIDITAPQGQTCSSSVTQGTIVNANITNIEVTCVTNTYTVGGTVSGLAENETVTLTLSPTGGIADDIVITGDAEETRDDAFAFDTAIAYDTTYTVTTTSPAGKTCTIAPAGEQTMGDANVTGIAVNCIATHSVSGTANGATNGRNIYIVLIYYDDNTGTDGTRLSIRANFNRTFTVADIPANKFYSLQAFSTTSGETCSGSYTTPTQLTADVTDVQFTCARSTTPSIKIRVLSVGNQASLATVNVFIGDDAVPATTGTPSQVIRGTDADVVIIPNIGGTGYDAFISDFGINAGQHYAVTVTSDAETCAVTTGGTGGPINDNVEVLIDCN